jgi:hypothetical protein
MKHEALADQNSNFAKPVNIGKRTKTPARTKTPRIIIKQLRLVKNLEYSDFLTTRKYLLTAISAMMCRDDQASTRMKNP